MKQPVLLIGGNSDVGGEVIRILLEARYPVIATVRTRHGNIWNGAGAGPNRVTINF